MLDGAESEEWLDRNFVALVDDGGRPVEYVARSETIAMEVLRRSHPDTPLWRAAEASLERRYDGGVLLPLCGFGTAAILLVSGAEAIIVISALVIGASTVGYLAASRPPQWKFVKRRLPSGASRLKASALGGLQALLLGTFGSIAGGGIFFLSFACACLPLLGMMMPFFALVQLVRNR